MVVGHGAGPDSAPLRRPRTKEPVPPGCILATVRLPFDLLAQEIRPRPAMVPSVRRVIVNPHRHLPLANAYICVRDVTGGGRTCQQPYRGAFGPLVLTAYRLK